MNDVGWTTCYDHGIDHMSDDRCPVCEKNDDIFHLRAQIDATLKDRALILKERDRTFALVLARAEAAEAKLAKLQHEAYEASHPDSLFGAMDNVADMDTSLMDYAEAASRAIRAAIKEIDNDH